MPGISLWDILRSYGRPGDKAVKLFDHLIGGMIARILPVSRIPMKTIATGHLKILIIRPGGIGDAVFLLPVIRALKAKGHSVDILCERRNAGIFNSQKDLFNRVLNYNVGHEFLSVFRQQYDVVVDTEQWHLLSAIVGHMIKHRILIGFDTRPSRARLLDIKVPYDLDQYELQNFARLFRLFDIREDLVLTHCYQIPACDREWAKTQASDPYIVISIGGSIALRRFSIQQATDICHHILKKNLKIVLLGGHDVTGLSRQITANLSDQRVINMTGQATLSQSAALIVDAKGFIGHDSGLLHLAAALGTPVTAFFGPGNQSKWGPRPEQGVILDEGLGCAPCTRFGYTLTTCHEKGICVRSKELVKRLKIIGY
ncbi:MAG: glycosyltransferase family 9 protein [Candidatus Omnitrophota bacterium]